MVISAILFISITISNFQNIQFSALFKNFEPENPRNELSEIIGNEQLKFLFSALSLHISKSTSMITEYSQPGSVK